MKQLHFRAYRLLVEIEALEQYKSDINTELLSIKRTQYNNVMQQIQAAEYNPVLMRYDANPAQPKRYIIPVTTAIGKPAFNAIFANAQKEIEKK